MFTKSSPTPADPTVSTAPVTAASSIAPPSGDFAPDPSSNYLDRLMRRKSFGTMWPLFAQATKPAKELTESFSALQHLRPLIKKVPACRVIHVGDGAHARTAALFALKTKSENISVDPIINERIVSTWRDDFNILRFAWRKARLEAAVEELNALPEMPTLITFVHAHVGVDDALASLRWDAAFTLACCSPARQLSSELTPVQEGEDFSILSPERQFQVLINPESALAQVLSGGE